MTKNRLVTEDMKSAFRVYLQRYYNDFKVFTCDATLATLLNMLYETSVVVATPAGRPASVANLRGGSAVIPQLIALSDLHTRDIHTAVDSRKSTENILRSLGKEAFTSICTSCGLNGTEVWERILEFCKSSMRVKSPEELKSKLTALFSHYNVDEVWVGSNCNIFDNLSCPEIYLISQEDTTQLKREIASLYEYCDSNGTYLYANVMDYIKTEAVDYFMSTAKQVYKGGKWL